MLASIHVPFWLDPRFCTSFRGSSCIDGSVYLPRFSEPALLARAPYALPDGDRADVRVFQFDDPRMQARYTAVGDFLATKTPDEKSEMMEWGASYVARLDASGALEPLDALRKASPTALRLAA